MACDQECKVKLRKVTSTGNSRYQRNAGPVTPNDPDLTRAEVAAAVAADITKRQKPTPLQPACPAGCECKTISETYAKNEDGSPKTETQWLPVDVSYYRPLPNMASGTYTIEYQATVQLGVGTGVCEEEPPRKVSSIGLIGEDAVLVMSGEAVVTDEVLALLAKALKTTVGIVGAALLLSGCK